MDATALNQLTYPKLQKLAQSHGVKANRKKVTIIQDLLDRYPDGVPSAPSQTRRTARPREPFLAPLPSENVAGPSVPRGAMPPPPPAIEAHRASRPAAGPQSPRREVASPMSPLSRPDATPVMPPRFRTGVGRSRSATHDSPIPQANAGPIPQALFPAGGSSFEPHPAPAPHGDGIMPANAERENDRGMRSPMRRPRSTHRDTRSPVYRPATPPPFAHGPAQFSQSRHHLPPQPQAASQPYVQPYPQSQWYPNLNPYSSLYPPSQPPPPPVHQSYAGPHYPHLPPLHLPPYSGALPHWSHDSNAYPPPQTYPLIQPVPLSFGMGSRTGRGESVADTAAMRQLTETMQYVAELNQATANMLPGIAQAADHLNEQVTRYRDQVRAEGVHRMRLQEMLTRFVRNSGNGEVGQAAGEDSWRRGHGEGAQVVAEHPVAEERPVEETHHRASRQAASPGLVRAGREILDSLDLQAASLPPAPASPRGVEAEAVAVSEAVAVAPHAPTDGDAGVSREDNRESVMAREDAREASPPREDNRESTMAREDNRESTMAPEDSRESAMAPEDNREASPPRENDEPEHDDSQSHPGSPNSVDEEEAGGPMPISPHPWSRIDQYSDTDKSSSNGSWSNSLPQFPVSFPASPSPSPSALEDLTQEQEASPEREPTPEREATPSARSGSSPRGLKRKRSPSPFQSDFSSSPPRSPSLSPPSDMLTPPSVTGADIYDGKPEPGDEEDLGSASSGSVDRFGTFKRRRLVGSVGSEPDNDRSWMWGVAEMRRLVSFQHVDEDIPRGYDTGDERLSSAGESTDTEEIFGLGESSDDEDY